MDIAAWLRGLGLEHHEPAFRDNGIDSEVLPELTAEDLTDLGVVRVGDRRKLLKAIAVLREGIAPASAQEQPPKIPDSAPVPQAERRQLTVMFCDLVGSTALSARLDPEDLRAVIGAYHRCVAGVIEGAGGFVAKYMGDGVHAYFGYPRADEHDAERAVRSGLQLIEAVSGLDTAAETRLDVRIGIATGLVVVGDLIGKGAAQEQAVVGETPNLAARLQALAAQNTLVISESTRRQLGALFEVADLGPRALRGFVEPQRAWRVLAENSALGRFEALRSPATPLVGREEELDLLLRRWAKAKARSGRAVLISGEPGVGKSRLAEALAERVAGEQHTRLRYFCSPHHQESALYPIIAQMERAAVFARDDLPETRLGKLQASLAAARPSAADVALIAELHSLPAAEIAPPLDVTPQKKKEMIFEALLRQLDGFSRCEPVLMVFEDLHWVDPSSRELLDRITERIKHWPVLLLATFRPEFQSPWTGQPHVTMLTLARLDQHDTAAMIANVAGNDALPATVVEEIAERTDGIPLFVEELTKAVLESSAPAAAVLAAAPHPALAVPATLHASLMARLDRLGPASKDVAQKGAVIGREFAYDLLAATADLPEPQLREALDRLANSGLVLPRRTPPQSTYVFKHALVQDTAYSTLLRGRRQQLHGRVAATLEANVSGAMATHPEVLAYHFAEAGLAERAIKYLGLNRFAVASGIVDRTKSGR
jgi:class 3 adenylate cyclase